MTTPPYPLLEHVEPRDLLRQLEAKTGTFRVSFEGETTSVTLEVVNGTVLGARAETREGDKAARPALEALLRLPKVRARIERRQFAELGNLVCPVVLLLAGRPFLPGAPEAERRRSRPPRHPPRAPKPGPRETTLRPAPRPPEPPPAPRRTRRPLWGIALAAFVATAIALWLLP